jgi:hypothetical protein
MRCLEFFYDPSSRDWDQQADKALEKIDYIPTVILCYPREEKRTNQSQINLGKLRYENQTSAERIGY